MHALKLAADHLCQIKNLMFFKMYVLKIKRTVYSIKINKF
jgi:hypothetical protein